MISFAREYDIHVEIFEKEPFWTDAITRSGGVRLLSDAQIPEEWQLKQFTAQLSTAVKQRQKCKAGLQDLSFIHYLSKFIGLPVSILEINIDLACMKRKDFVKKKALLLRF